MRLRWQGERLPQARPLGAKAVGLLLGKSPPNRRTQTPPLGHPRLSELSQPLSPHLQTPTTETHRQAYNTTHIHTIHTNNTHNTTHNTERQHRERQYIQPYHISQQRYIHTYHNTYTACHTMHTTHTKHTIQHILYTYNQHTQCHTT